MSAPRRCLVLGTLLLTIRTVISLVTGSAFLYFAQPLVGTIAIAVVLLVSALAGRPFTQRFAHDFCPIDPEILARPRIHRFFRQISVLWAATLLLNSGLVLWLLLSSSLHAFVLERTAVSWGLTAVAITLSILGFVAAMRRDGVTVRWCSSRRRAASRHTAVGGRSWLNESRQIRHDAFGDEEIRRDRFGTRGGTTGSARHIASRQRSRFVTAMSRANRPWSHHNAARSRPLGECIKRRMQQEPDVSRAGCIKSRMHGCIKSRMRGCINRSVYQEVKRGLSASRGKTPLPAE